MRTDSTCERSRLAPVPSDVRTRLAAEIDAAGGHRAYARRTGLSRDVLRAVVTGEPVATLTRLACLWLAAS